MYYYCKTLNNVELGNFKQITRYKASKRLLDFILHRQSVLTVWCTFFRTNLVVKWKKQGANSLVPYATICVKEREGRSYTHIC